VRSVHRQTTQPTYASLYDGPLGVVSEWARVIGVVAFVWAVICFFLLYAGSRSATATFGLWLGSPYVQVAMLSGMVLAFCSHVLGARLRGAQNWATLGRWGQCVVVVSVIPAGAVVCPLLVVVGLFALVGTLAVLVPVQAAVWIGRRCSRATR
jgi:hypothetical protein